MDNKTTAETGIVGGAFQYKIYVFQCRPLLMIGRHSVLKRALRPPSPDQRAQAQSK